MSIEKLSSARKYLASLRGGPLTFGRLIESTRACDEISQIELAKQVGVSRAYLCDIEKGRRNVSPELAARFATKLGYSVNQFVALAVEDQLKKAGFAFKVKLEAA
jgi:transcriptional regulator with XRE-family HTH domain